MILTSASAMIHKHLTHLWPEVSFEITPDTELADVLD